MADHAGSFNGLAFGPGTSYGLKTLRWWRRATDVQNPALPRYHGALVGASYETAKELQVGFILRGAVSEAGLVSLVEDLYAAFQPQVDTESPFVWEPPGLGERIVFCRPVEDGDTRLEPEDWASKAKEIQFRLAASDPAIYGDEVQITLNPQAPAEGLSYPVTYPKQYGAAGTSGETFSNTGEWETWPVFQINGGSGTMTDPSIIAPTLNMKLALTANGGVSILPGQVLEISTHPNNRFVRFTTGASRYGKLSADSEFFALPKGDTELRFQASGDTTGADVDVIARPAWI